MFPYKFSLFSISIILFSMREIGTDSVQKKETDCELNILCGDCLQQLGCVWCIEPVHSSSLDRETHCMSKNSNDLNICPVDLLVNPNSTQNIISQKPLQSTKSNHVQITPQKIELTMRLGEERQIHFKYAQAKNYPIDLYYIMDYSASMEDHRVALAKLGNELTETMKKKTSNFRIGFGTFVDKVDMPFTSILPEKLKSPCTLRKDGQVIVCVSPYSFKNHMSLSQNYTKFSLEVSRAKISGNLDTPEGGFDALMQAIVCKNEIGWRDKARHLLVFSTDADFHIAGDGKLAGVLLPNDAQCHMTENEYNAGLTYDYPSVSHLNYVAKKNNINLIFAIVGAKKDVPDSKGDVLESYRELSKNIENSNVGAIDERSENVIDLVSQNYDKIVDRVVIDINSNDKVDVKLTSNCSNKIERGCSDIPLGGVVDFTANIKPITCEGHNGEPIIISLKPEAVDESLTIELNLICGCDCEKSGNPHNFQNFSDCTNFGDLVCGVCKCLPGRSGEQCECDGRESHSHNITNCIQKPGAQVCSGLGKCTCGKCDCFKRSLENQKISGKYCQCDNYSCIQKNGLLCAGKGTCSCGRCVCNAGWSGNACECPDGNCIDSRKNLGVCSGRGICKCGKCECSETYYTGEFCEKCPTCKDRCKELENCVKCKVFQTGPFKGEGCDSNCSVYTIKEQDEINEEKGEKICRSIDTESCTIRYKYSYELDKYNIINVLTQKSCPPNVLAWTLAVIGTIVIAGIIMLLIWKIFTSIHDKREYVKFENERKSLKWHANQNPLYKNATTTFQNPVYNK